MQNGREPLFGKKRNDGNRQRSAFCPRQPVDVACNSVVSGQQLRKQRRHRLSKRRQPGALSLFEQGSPDLLLEVAHGEIAHDQQLCQEVARLDAPTNGDCSKRGRNARIVRMPLAMHPHAHARRQPLRWWSHRGPRGRFVCRERVASCREFR